MSRNSNDLKKILKLNEGEQVLFSHKPDTRYNIIFYIFWVCFSLLFLVMVILTYWLEAYFYFYFSLVFLIIMNIACIFLCDLLLSIGNGNLYITNERVIFIYSKGLFKFKRKYKEIDLHDISFVQIWADSIRITKKRRDGVERYTGKEIKYRYWTSKRYTSISFSIINTSKSEIPQKILNALSENISFVEHPNLKEIYLFKNPNSNY
ncbi:MAG: hypothetical protein ACFE9S_14510 [Candidatus Hermodarchaeota archaeon]